MLVGESCNSPHALHPSSCILFHLVYLKLGMMLDEMISCGDKIVESEFELLLGFEFNASWGFEKGHCLPGSSANKEEESSVR